MPHNIDLILTLTGGLTAALALGFLTHKLKLSPIVGYLLAGVIVGPHSPGFVADENIAAQCAEIGVILLMFGVGLHFHLKDLLAVRTLAIPGAIVQIAVATGLGAVITRAFGWSWSAGIVFGMAIAVASTVVLTRVLADNRDLHTPTGHVAIGWLIVEDLFTIFALVLLPAFFGPGSEDSSLAGTLGWAVLKLVALFAFALIAGQKLIPWILGTVARTGARDLFTLAVLVLALGIAVGSAELFGASMALGAFLAGMIVGQSDFSARATADALPMRDAFAVLFFVSVGMLFDPSGLAEGWPLMLATIGIVIIGKPLAAMVVVLLFRRPLREALSISVALAQIGEFSFIVAALGISLQVLPVDATNAIVVAAVVSITLNPLLYKAIRPFVSWLESRGHISPRLITPDGESPASEEGAERVIMIGHGPVGSTLTRLLRDNQVDVVVVEMNLETITALKASGIPAVYGDATQRQTLHHVGIENAKGLVITASDIPARDIVQAAREINPHLQILSRAPTLRDVEPLKQAGADAVFSGEGEVALAMSSHLLRSMGASDAKIEGERVRFHEEFLQAPSA